MKKVIATVGLICFIGIAYGQSTLALNTTAGNKCQDCQGICSAKNENIPSKHTAPFDILIKSSVVTNSSLLNINLANDTDSIRFEVFDSHGETMELMFEGSMLSGQHQFEFIPASGITRPFIAVLSIATKVVSMRVVKFNSF